MADGGNAIYLCVDANGRKELTDNGRKGCKQLDLPGLIAAPPARRSEAPRPRAPVSTPGDFPKVDSAQQKARDDDRRAILAEELEAEEKKAAELRKEYKDGLPDRLGNERNYAKYLERVASLRDNIARTDKNIDALKRELANIK
ncbi:DUF4124 domain-containing protein [Massilia glaciei]|uniref:DUF4124 domain-containing protein n=1 Tax=Massilia glaciei TaxID=1524097 RepID=A0A2U2H8Z2_9BURK|nr:DUF4124 domain-containing protein [Massilia glaciei]